MSAKWNVAKAIFVLLTFESSLALAQSSARDALIDRVETEFVGTTMLAPDSPLMTSMLAPAMTANPGVTTETWQSVRADVAQSFTTLLTDKGGTFDAVIRASLGSLSDQELQRLSELLNDQAYKKFQATMSSASTQQQLQLGIMKIGMQIGPLINKILVTHQLHEVH